MSDVRKAIEILLDIDKDFGRYSVPIRVAARIAIEALQEKAARAESLSCECCSKDTVLMRKNAPYVFYGKQLEDNEIFVIYDDRGYLRLGYDDFNCLDHGEKYKINYCPMCGRKLVEEG